MSSIGIPSESWMRQVTIVGGVTVVVHCQLQNAALRTVAIVWVWVTKKPMASVSAMDGLHIVPAPLFIGA